MANEQHEPEYVKTDGGEYWSLVKFIAGDLIDMARKRRVEDTKNPEGRQDVWMEISEGILAEGGERFVNHILEQVNLRLFTYEK